MQAFNDSGLQYAEGSHRDMAMHFTHSGSSSDLSGRGYRIGSAGEHLPCHHLCTHVLLGAGGLDKQICCAGKMDLGDVSWHHGWLLHSAPGQQGPARTALAVSYFGDGARVRSMQRAGADASELEDLESYADWAGSAPGKLRPGSLARHALTPVIRL